MARANDLLAGRPQGVALLLAFPGWYLLSKGNAGLAVLIMLGVGGYVLVEAIGRAEKVNPTLNALSEALFDQARAAAEENA